MPKNDDIQARIARLRGWLARRLSGEQIGWLDERLAKISGGARRGDLAISVGLAPRKLGKADLELSADEMRTARALRPGLDASTWSVDQTARILFVLASYAGDDAAFAETLDRLFQTGEISEHIALLRGLPLYPAATRLGPRAAEGLRSAVQPVFEAVAHQNPFPQECFDEAQWNQMVLKALFIGSRLAPIQGLDERRNADLAATLMDYVHERWAAGRAVSPELWRCVGVFARAEDVADLVSVLRRGDEVEATAAALALSESSRTDARDALATVPALSDGIRAARITWSTIQHP